VPTSARLLKVNEKLKVDISKILAELVDVDGTLTTVMGVETSPTMEHATVWISVYPSTGEKPVMAKIRNSIYDIQQHVNRLFRARKVPKLLFSIDRSEEQVARIDEILSKDR
jgi:ribosome-binding factor A